MSVPGSIVALCLAICMVCVATEYQHGCHLDCGSHGHCVEHNDNMWCDCHDGWTWTQHGCHSYGCQDNTHCQNQGHCNSGICHCSAGWSGPTCGTWVDACASSPCQNGGHCWGEHTTSHYACHCHHGFSGDNCENHITTAAASETTTTTRPTTITTTAATVPTTAVPTTAATATTPSPLYNNHCQKFATVSDIAMLTIASNADASVCPASGEHRSPDAFVLNHCNVTVPATWKQGVNLMTSCVDIPLYTPIATFANGVYVTAGSACGVFMGCTATGFRIGIQHCDQAPAIEHIEIGGIYTSDPYNYFTIQ